MIRRNPCLLDYWGLTNMLETLNAIGVQLYIVFATNNPFELLIHYMPVVIVLELPMQILMILGIVKYHIHEKITPAYHPPYYPLVSVIITCYAEGKEVAKSILSMAEQIYPGKIEIIAIVDGASVNTETYLAVKELQKIIPKYKNRVLTLIPKWKRGGRVSASNMALHFTHGEIVMALDGDSSCDNNLLLHATRAFIDPNVVGTAGAIRVRNLKDSVITHLQGLEYMIAIHAIRNALSQFNTVNIISGALGLFRRKFLIQLMGWDSGSGEDLDITLRIQNYFGRHPNLRIHFEPKAVMHTDAPSTVIGYLKQRLRWDGDLFYIYARKHWRSFNPRLIGWKNLLFVIWSALIFQIFLPLAIIAYTTYTFIAYSAPVIIATFMVVYLYYLITMSIVCVLFICWISERKKEDVKLLPYMLLMPFYTFGSRIWSAVAIANEVFLRSHQDTSMAPWWVLKKSRF